MKETPSRQVARRISSECLAVRVRRLGRVVTRIYDAALAPHGVTIAQLNLLAAIGAIDGQSSARLGRVLEVEKSTLSRDLKRMEQLGWIRSGPSESGRGRSLLVTAAGARLLMEARPAWEKAQRSAQSRLGQGAFAQLRQVLRPPGA